jgi:hypothetical protein
MAVWKFVVIWYIFPILVCLEQEQSGNPAGKSLTPSRALKKLAETVFYSVRKNFDKASSVA